MKVEKKLKFDLSRPSSEDGKEVADFVRQAGTLEANSTYTYLLLCSHFSQTCVLGRSEGRLVGVLLGYRLPAEPSTLFLWQVGTSERMRGQGLAQAMLTALKERVRELGVTHFSLTIAPSNTASWSLFSRWAERSELTLKQGDGFSQELFGGENHESEALVTIGPF